MDDEEAIRTFASHVLTTAGYEVMTASGGPEAQRIVNKSGAFDLFLIDLVMPEMTGQDLAQWLRARDSKAKVLYFTGHSDHLFEDPDRNTLSEHEAFLAKPVTVNGLVEAVSRLLPGRVAS